MIRFAPLAFLMVVTLAPLPTQAAMTYTYTTFNLPSSTTAGPTIGRGINTLGAVAGDGGGGGSPGFVRRTDGTFMTFRYPGASLSNTYGINDSGQVAGSYLDGTGSHGFLRSTDGATYTSFNSPGRSISVGGLNNLGQISGNFTDSTGQHGYIRASDGTFTTFDLPGQPGLQINGISNLGAVTGYFVPRGSPTATSFIRAEDGSLTTFQVPEAGRTGTFAEGINRLGQVAGFYYDSANMVHSFIRSADGSTFDTLNVTGAIRTTALGINDRGQITGFYVDANNAMRGFIATPNAAVPEPCSLFLSTTAILVGLEFARSRRVTRG